MPFPKTDGELKQAGYKFVSKGKCKLGSCQADIEWWETPKGKMMPLDSGTMEPHWSTCKDANRFRGTSN